MLNNLRRMGRRTEQTPDTSTSISINNLNSAITSLHRLKGMFGAVIYLATAQGVKQGYPVDDFEGWFSDIQDKLDEVVNLISED